MRTGNCADSSARRPHISVVRVVGLGRFELPTSRLSGVRSNQLSYRPALQRAIENSIRATFCRSVDCHRTGRADSLKTEQERVEEGRRYSDSYRPRVQNLRDPVLIRDDGCSLERR
jgi:hypothetical protein